MKAFHPYNLELISSKQEYEARGKTYISFCLEMPSQETLVDALAEIVIHKIHFDPLPQANKMFLIMTLHSHKPNMFIYNILLNSRFFIGSLSFPLI